MIYDLAIKNCRMVKPTGIFAGDIVVRGGKIESIAKTAMGAFKEIIDAKGSYILPGVIDTHVHLGTTDQTFSESLRTESRAAAAGGVTTALVYKQIPSSREAKNDLEKALVPDIRAIEEGSLIDVGFHGLILVEEALEPIEELVERYGITSFKFIMAYKGEEAMPHFYGMSDGSLFKAMERVGRTKGCLSLIHAENSEINERFKKDHRQRQETGAWSDARPALSEEEGIRRAVFLAERAGSPLCVAHVSAEGGARYISDSKKRNPFLFQETCPQYLSLTKESRFVPPAVGKANPPLREKADVLALWDLMGKGAFDVIGSDHCPFTLKMKHGDLWGARPGFPGIGLILPVLLSEGVNKGRITLEDVSRITSFLPSKLFGLHPKKGAMEAGSDADLVMIDLEKEAEVTHSMLKGISDYTPYEGCTLKGWPTMTIARGRVVFREGQIEETVEKGAYLKRKRMDKFQ